MSYLVLARKYRPQKFDEVFAQEQVTDILKNAIKMNRIAHSYLFTGPRGVGKTSMARIFAKSLNCENGPTNEPCNVCQNCKEITQTVSNDVIEIDGASNTGVNDIRDLQKELMYSPTHSRYKIYIIDEVHMLSKSAFNALLKTLEEPPDDVIFIFATTEPHKVLPTIISRCQRYDFKRIPIEAIVKNLSQICQKEDIKIEEEALFVIARKADGGMRDALSLMDQVISLGKDKILLQDVLEIFGMVDIDSYSRVINAIHDKDITAIIKELHRILEKGYDLQEFLSGLMAWIRNILLVKLEIKSSEIPPSYIAELKQIATGFNQNQLLYLISFLIKTKADLKLSENPVLIAEMAFIKLTKLSEMNSLESILDKISSGNYARPQANPKSSTNVLNPDNQKQSVQDVVPKRTVKKESTSIKKKIVKEATSQKPKITNLTAEILDRDGAILIKKLEREIPVSVKSFQKTTLEKISNNFIHYRAKTKFAYLNLDKNKDKISAIFSKHFGLHIKVDFVFTANKDKKKEIVRNPTLQDIEKYSEDLAHLIRETDSIITRE